MEVTAVNNEALIIEKYPAYKDSGVAWLGEIPAHWELTRVKNVFRLVAEPAPKNNDFELLSVYTDIGVKPRKELEERGNKASTTDGYWFVTKGDIVVNKLLAWMGAIGVSNYDGVTSPAYDILRAKIQLNSNFFHYLFRTEMCVSELKKYSRGIMDMRLRLYFDKFGDILIPLPSFLEQQRIVTFLDRKTAQIDQAIRIKEKQIALLKERRQILIHHAVTRGLNKDVPMKDSGVELLGKIPSNWDIIKFKYIIRTKARLGWKGLKASEYVDESNYGFLSTPNIKNSEIDFDKAYFISKKRYEESPEIMLERNDVLLVKDGSTLGIVNIIKDLPFCCTVNSSIAVLRISKSEILDAEFLRYFLESDYSQKVIELKKDGMGVPHLFQSDINNFIVIIPPKKEQQVIVKYVETVTKKIETAISCKINEIEKLKEYKATLINSAVTGKIKV